VDASAESSDVTQSILDSLSNHNLSDHIVRIIYRTDSGPAHLDLPRIRQATRDAALVAGIFPDTERAQKQRRSAVTHEMGLSKALEAYIDNNSSLNSIKNDLLSYAMTLESEESVT
jgi:hypothetical protein